MKMLVFINYKDGWEIHRPDSESEKRTISMDNLLNKMKNNPSDVAVGIEVAPGELGPDNRRIVAKGYNGMIKQVETIGGCSYVVPTYKGEYMNEYIWIGDAAKEVLGEFPEVIYFKKY